MMHQICCGSTTENAPNYNKKLFVNEHQIVTIDGERNTYTPLSYTILNGADFINNENEIEIEEKRERLNIALKTLLEANSNP